jgi:hypothetical protein
MREKSLLLPDCELGKESYLAGSNVAIGR